MDDSNKGKNSGMERRNTTGSDSSQPQKSSSIIRDGIEIFNYKNPATVVTFGLVAFVFFIICLTLMVDRRGRTEIEKIVIDTVPKVKLDEDGPTIRKQIQLLNDKDRDLGYGIDKCLAFEPRISFCESWINDPENKYNKGKVKGKK